MRASIIIPTYGRDSSVIIRTLDSLAALGNELEKYCNEIYLIDQNATPLKLEEWINSHKKEVRLIHITKLPPSVTKAKNYAIKMSTDPYLIFFDDDVLVQKGTLMSYIEVLKANPHIGFLGGREILQEVKLKKSLFRRTLLKIAKMLTKPFSPKNEEEYLNEGRYVGRIQGNSFMYCDFDQTTKNLPIKIDTARGCTWATTREMFDKAQGFDENFQGTALREETDLYLRIRAISSYNYFVPLASVIHLRQLGGCNNLAQAKSVLISKFDNELYFQFKHFLQINVLYFFIRMLPICLESIKMTKGLSLIILIQYTGKLFALKHFTQKRENYLKSFLSPVLMPRKSLGDGQI